MASLEAATTCTGDSSADDLIIDLSDQGIGDRSIAQKVEEWQTLTLTSLILLGNDLSDKAASTLSSMFASSGFGSLTYLNLQDNLITDTGAKNLAESICLQPSPTLRVLRFGYNDIGEQGAAALIHALGNVLCELDLQYNALGPAVCDAFAVALESGNCSIVSLGLLKTGIGLAGAATLGRSLSAYPRSHLRSLDLGSNELGDEGVCAFVEAFTEKERAAGAVLEPACSCLERLFLFDNEVGVVGAQALATVLSKSAEESSHGIKLRLTNLDLEENDVCDLAEDDDEHASACLQTIESSLSSNRNAKVAASAARLRQDPTVLTKEDEESGETISLDFEGDKIGDEGCIVLAEAIDEYNKIFGSRHSNGAADDSSPSVSNTHRFPLLRSLNLNENGITTSSIDRLTTAIENNSTLIEVSLKYNSGLGAEKEELECNGPLARIGLAIKKNRALDLKQHL